MCGKNLAGARDSFATANGGSLCFYSQCSTGCGPRRAARPTPSKWGSPTPTAPAGHTSGKGHSESPSPQAWITTRLAGAAPSRGVRAAPPPSRIAGATPRPVTASRRGASSAGPRRCDRASRGSPLCITTVLPRVCRPHPTRSQYGRAPPSLPLPTPPSSHRPIYIHPLLPVAGPALPGDASPLTARHGGLLPRRRRQDRSDRWAKDGHVWPPQEGGRVQEAQLPGQLGAVAVLFH